MAVRLLMLLLLLVPGLTGCGSTKKGLASRKPLPEANVPPRRAQALSDPVDQGGQPRSADASNIALTEFSPDRDQPVEMDGATVVATVNSTPLFAGDVLAPYSRQLEKAAAQLTPEELNRLKTELVQKTLSQHVEKAVLVSALRDGLKKEQIEQLDERIDAMWEQEIQRLMSEFKVETRLELERALEQENATLSELKTSFASREMAMFYLSQKTKRPERLSREELKQWYDTHRSQFETREQVRWQQIRISAKRDGGRAAAADRLRTVVAELKAGGDFTEVAKKYSDGPRAETGGVWDWTTRGALSEEEVERAIFTLEPGRISSPMELNGAFVLVRVIERQAAGLKPFEDVQDEINRKLLTEGREEAIASFIKAETARAQVWTIFDTPPRG